MAPEIFDAAREYSRMQIVLTMNGYSASLFLSLKLHKGGET
jgi:hypothetical protein